jgi:hypothetical protein
MNQVEFQLLPANIFEHNVIFPTDAQKGVSRWTCISNLNDARVVMETLMQNYVQADRDLAAANERLAEREFSMEKEITRLREQLEQQQEQQKIFVEPKVKLVILVLFT